MLTFLGILNGNPFWWVGADFVLLAGALAVLAP